jgi:ubiquinone/menaquinone biosynthesis C-methylase UbiE
MSSPEGRRRRSRGPDRRTTEQTRRSYDRIARFYDPMETLVEGRYRSWRERLWSLVTGPEVLEIGVGTGKNIPFYPSGITVTAVDLSPRMLERAARLAGRLNATVDLQLADAQALGFADHRFDEVVATFVFCSVPDQCSGSARRSAC